MQVQTLIERAAAKYGTQTAVAEAVGVRPHRMSEWKTGTVPCPIEIQAELCELAGLPEPEAKDHIYRAVRALAKARRANGVGGLKS